ncbi:MAG: alkanesulfonate monooxygenase SsuD [Glaciecola sp.]|jgi:alkanesulfonate monooxygenase SsuD/methylene tetrahydromethanopterin reductase-like flavin-dependent oxidoreductase (luciferase family)
MKLDLFYEIDVPRPWPGEHPYGQKKAEQESYKEAFEQIQLGDKLGFNTVWCVEHHFREGRSHMPTPEAVLGALSQITENIKLGFGVTLAPFDFIHPSRIAEKVATVDVLSHGRVEWGLGRSTPMEQMAFGVDPTTSKEQLREAARIVAGMWREEYFEYESETFSFPRRMVTPKPYQDPSPQGWIAATSMESSIIAGDHGMGLLSFAIMQPISQMADLIYNYKQAAKTATDQLLDIANNRAACYTLVHCVEDEADLDKNRAWESVWWWYKNIAEFTLEWELAHMPKEKADALFPLLTKFADGDIDPKIFNDYDMIMIGTPDQIVPKMKKYADCGVDQLLCYKQFGFLPHDSIMTSMELLNKHVMPELDSYQPDPDNNPIMQKVKAKYDAEHASQ